MKNYFFLAATGVASFLLATCQPLQAQTVIYSDSFNRTTGSSDINGLPADPNNFSDWGMNDNALGGTVQQTWFVGPTNRTGGANQSTDGTVGGLINGGTMFDYDVTTVAPGGFSVGFDFNRFHPINPGAGNGFIALGFGRSVPEDPTTYGALGALNLSDFVVLFQQANLPNLGNAQFFQDSTVAATEFLPGTAALGPLDYGDPTIQHSVLITLTPQVAGQYGDADVIDFSVVVDGSASFSSTVLGGDNFGKLAFSSNQAVHRYIDNLVVTALPFTAVDNADFDSDSDVDGHDFLTWQRNFGTGTTLAQGDANNSGTVNAADLAIWKNQYGPGSLAAIAAVPEPSSLLLLLGCLGLGGLRRVRS